MELYFWQAMTVLASFTAMLAIGVMAMVMYADHRTYRRGR